MRGEGPRRLRPSGPWESGPPAKRAMGTGDGLADADDVRRGRAPGLWRITQNGRRHFFTESVEGTGGSMCTLAEPMSK
jgi:hypothetical protein